MKILYVTTISDTINAFLVPHIKMLVQLGHDVDVACSIEQPLESSLLNTVSRVYDVPFVRNPISPRNVRSYKDINRLIMLNDYSIVHTHTPVASAIVRVACMKSKNIKVFYTAHGFHFHKGASVLSWLLYYPLEKWLSKYTNTLITINKEDFNLAKKVFRSERIEYVPGVGLDLKKFTVIKNLNKSKRQELGIPNNAFVVVSVGELNKNKNHEVIIKAISRSNDSGIHYVICGEGQLSSYLHKISKKHNVESNVHILGFRTDIAEILHASDIFAFPSFREGLGLAAIEAMACGLPIVTSNVHGILDYSSEGVSGYLNDPRDINGFMKSMLKLRNDEQLRRIMGESNSISSLKYDIVNILERMKEIYND